MIFLEIWELDYSLATFVYYVTLPQLQFATTVLYTTYTTLSTSGGKKAPA